MSITIQEYLTDEQWRDISAKEGSFSGPFPVLAIGDYLLQNDPYKTSKIMSLKKLIKLAYIAHGWFLGLTDGKHKLVEDDVEAWEQGPVYPEIYNVLRPKVQSSSFLLSDDMLSYYHRDILEDSAEALVMKKILATYGSRQESFLMNITHQAGSPWHKAIRRGKTIIPNETICEYYVNKLKEVEKQQ